MKIAIPYENGQVFAHFGKAEQFKFYTVNEDEILSEEVLDTDGTGHGALSDFLKKEDVNMVICGGIGVGAVQALKDAKIQIMGGASGEADERVKDFLNGMLHFDTAGGASCGMHGGCGGHGHGGHDDEAECDGNISACGSCCH